jgi:hypothetical protein
LIAQLIQKSDAHEITSSPDDLARTNVVEIIERKFEVQGQDIEVLQFNSRAARCYIADAAGKNATLLVKEQERGF